MKILQIPPGGDRIPSDRAGGLEGHIFFMSKQLSTMGHEVTVLDRKHSPNDDSFQRIEGVNIIRLPAKFFRPTMLERGNLPFLYLIRGSLNTLSHILKVKEYLAQGGDFDAIYVYIISAAFLLLILDRESMEKCFYVHSSVDWQPQSWSILNRLLTLLGRFTLKRVNMVIVENHSMRAVFMTHLKLPEQKIALIPAGMDTGLFSVDIGVNAVKDKYRLDGMKLILSVGRIHKQKGMVYLVKAANILVNHYHYQNALFIIVGGMSPLEKLSEQRGYEIEKPRGYAGKLFEIINSLKLATNVKLTGYVPFDELRRLYLACDVFTLPSVVEQFGQVITEAMASGRPVVASKTPGALMQVRDGWNGFLVEIGNERELADKIRYLLDRPEEAKRMGLNARKSAKELDWAIIAQKYLEVYHA